MSNVNTYHSTHGDILVVEDNKADLKFLSGILSKAGYTVRPASDGELALRSVQARLPALILLDIVMPGLDGYEVCRRLKDSEDTRGIPVIFVSVGTSPLEKVKAFGLGCVDYICKPFEPEEVLARVATHLALWKAQKEVGDKNLQLQQEVTERKKAEEALRGSERNYRLLFESTLDGLIVIDETMKILMANQAAAEMAGFDSVEALLKANVLDYIPPEDRERFLTIAVKDGFESDLRQVNEFRVVNNAGKEMWVSAVGTVIEYQGKPAILASFRDITERKRAEERIEHLNLVLRAIRNVNQLMIGEQDRESLLKGLCDKLIESRGYYNAWVALMDEGGRLVTTAEAGLGIDFLPMLERLKRGELTACGEKALSYAGVVITEDPASDCADCPLSAKYGGRGAMTVRLEHEGKVYGLLSVSIPTALIGEEEEQRLFQELAGDIAFALHGMELEQERKRLDEKLRESEEMYRNLVSNLADVVLEIDSEGKFTYVSPQIFDIFGYTPEESIGLNAFEFIHPDDIQRCLEAMSTVPEVHNLEYRSRHKDGHYVHVSTSGKFVPDGRSGTKITSVVRDITERKQAEEEKKKLEQRAHLASRLSTVGEMASGIAHEINNPLTGVVGFSDLLLKKDIPDDIRESVKIIYNGAQRVAGITSRLLTFAHQSRPERTCVNINDVIETTLALRAYEMRSSNIEASTEVDPDLPSTMADAGQLQQVFLNIILNAEAEMTRAHGRGNLLVKTERMDNAIRISFKDDGPGMPKEHLDKIFDPFFTTREVGQGTGLGLSVSHGIVTGHGGRIYAQSELGKGATFFVELPIVTEAEQLKPVEPPAAEPRKVSGGRILVVDDEPLVQQFLARMLSEEGHEVETTDNGDDALEKLQSEDYDVVLLDIKLPGMSGIEIYEHLQRAAKPLASRVVFITGDVMSEDTMAFLSRAKAPYITKPFDTEQLIDAINTMLTRRG